eukprot:CAMPEP_0180426040 /NCGR_PEP_ID=MMETSP1036_2-20121128/5587_1 /TAXON_ID=632150 /ORGANISM="Azadinium spinosum, Strain 3D9" /LENGTH=78 /DNA_ID=CAMNT_0022431575 /DNA_START=599 /DNA_END=835 /DNA_ORIENTATION=-
MRTSPRFLARGSAATQISKCPLPIPRGVGAGLATPMQMNALAVLHGSRARIVIVPRRSKACNSAAAFEDTSSAGGNTS